MLGPTNYRGDRVKATAMSSWDNKPKPSVTIPYDYGMRADENHRLAAMKLLPKVVSEHLIDEVILIEGACDRGYIFTPILPQNIKRNKSMSDIKKPEYGITKVMKDIQKITEEYVRTELLLNAEKEPDFRGWKKAPWGRHRILTTSKELSQQIKILEINPDEMISLQSHKFRAEQWVILQGTGELTVGKEKRIMFPKDTVWFPAGTKHRIHNGNLNSIMVILEIQTGTSFDENDITRYEDKYGRVTEK
tara:strand:+ start:5759 stop:6502 length:744 start_codon:yes stop_codon:yes gene_type:complete